MDHKGPSRGGSRAAIAPLSELAKAALLYIYQVRPSAAELATLLGVAVPTASRAVAALRKSGIDLVSVRAAEGWHYEVRDGATDLELARDPLLQASGSVRRWRRESASEDDIIYR